MNDDLRRLRRNLRSLGAGGVLFLLVLAGFWIGDKLTEGNGHAPASAAATAPIEVTQVRPTMVAGKWPPPLDPARFAALTTGQNGTAGDEKEKVRGKIGSPELWYYGIGAGTNVVCWLYGILADTNQEAQLCFNKRAADGKYHLFNKAMFQ